MVSAEVPKSRLVHTPVVPIASEEGRRAKQACRGDSVELGLIVATTNLGKFASINLTSVLPGESLPTSLTRSSIEFLLNTQVIENRLDEKKVKAKMEYLEKYSHSILYWRLAYNKGVTRVDRAIENTSLRWDVPRAGPRARILSSGQ